MADISNIIRYGSRTFSEYREDIIAYIRRAYPEILSDFTDSSVGSMFIDINAGVANNLSINIDRAFQETQLEYAQQRWSILNIAKTMGFNIPPRRPSVTIVDFTVVVPVLGDKPDSNYYPVLQSGAQVTGGGQIFETQYSIDWNSPYSSLGDPNRSIKPNKNSNGVIVSYNVTKREVVVNGKSNIYRRVITSSDVTPFFSVILPEPNVISVDGVILVEGNNGATPDTSQFDISDNKFYEVDYLAQQRVFVINSSRSLDPSGIKSGTWIDVTKKFIKEYTADGYCKLTFGSGDSDVNAFRDGFLKEGVSNRYFLDNFLYNTSLGEKLRAGYTLYVKYKVGGGSGSNIGTGILNQMGTYNLVTLGSRQDIRRLVQKSLTVTNPIPAIGGNDGLSIEQIRQLIKYNYSSQNRAVSIDDYKLQVYKMPGIFGSPFRVNSYKQNNKVVLPILDIGSDGKLSNTSNSLLKENISEYLSQSRMINDYIEIKDGRIFNLGYEIEVYVSNINDNEIANNIIRIIRDYHDINNHEMNRDIYVSKLQTEILKVSGVMNIISIKVFNKVGGEYSNNVIDQKINKTTGEINVVNNTIYSTPDSMFEIKYPERDIKVLMRKSMN